MWPFTSPLENSAPAGFSILTLLEATDDIESAIILPLTSNASEGVSVPIPTFPPLGLSKRGKA